MKQKKDLILWLVSFCGVSSKEEEDFFLGNTGIKI